LIHQSCKLCFTGMPTRLPRNQHVTLVKILTSWVSEDQDFVTGSYWLLWHSRKLKLLKVSYELVYKKWYHGSSHKWIFCHKFPTNLSNKVPNSHISKIVCIPQEQFSLQSSTFAKCYSSHVSLSISKSVPYIYSLYLWPYPHGLLPCRQLPACCHNLGKPNLFSQASIEKVKSTCNVAKIDPEDPSSVITVSLTHGLKKITCSQVPSPDITARNSLFDKNDMSRMPHVSLPILTLAHPVLHTKLLGKPQLCTPQNQCPTRKAHAVMTSLTHIAVSLWVNNIVCIMTK
jgi:hypothetical protein